MRALFANLLLIASGMTYAAEESISVQAEGSASMQVIPQPVPFDLERLQDPALESLVQSLPYETVISLKATSRTFRNKLRESRFAELLPTKLIEYWLTPLLYVTTAPEKPKKYPHIEFIKFSPKGRYIATSDMRGTFFLWQLQPSKLMMGQNIPVMGKKAIKIRKWRKGESHIRGLFQVFRVVDNSPIAFSPDGTTLACAFQDKIFLWDVITGKLKDQLHDKPRIWSITFSPNGQLLACISADFIKLINLKTHEIIQEMKAEESVRHLVAFSHDGSILTFSVDQQTMDVWHIEENAIKRIGRLKHFHDLSSVAFSPDGTTLAIGLENGDINLWRVKIDPDGTLSGTDQPISVLSHPGDPAKFLAFSRYGAILASATSAMHCEEVRLWNVRTGQQFTALKGHGPIAFSPDGLLLATIGRNGYMGLWQQQHTETLP